MLQFDNQIQSNFSSFQKSMSI